MDFADWFTQDTPVAFGHANYPLVPPLERFKLVVGLCKVDCSQILVYVVASELERHLLIEAVLHTGQASLLRAQGHVQIHSCASALRFLRRPVCLAWGRKHATFVCQFDASFSAQFALTMIELMYAADKSPLNKTYRLLVLSMNHNAHPALENTMDIACPQFTRFGQDSFTNVRLGDNENLDIATSPVPITPPGISVNYTYAKCLQAPSGSGVVVFCSQEIGDTIALNLAQEDPGDFTSRS